MDHFEEFGSGGMWRFSISFFIIAVAKADLPGIEPRSGGSAKLLALGTHIAGLLMDAVLIQLGAHFTACRPTSENPTIGE